MRSNNKGQEREITCQIIEHLDVITSNDQGWTKELNIISWNDMAPKYDIRDWSPDHSKMGRGITLYASEMEAVVDAYVKNRDKGLVGERQ